VGSVTVGTPGSTPLVSITGAAPAQTISFVLPPASANQLAIGTVEQGPAAYAEIVGPPPNQILNLVLPNPAVYQSTSFRQNPTPQTVTAMRDVTFSAYASSTEWPIVYSWQESADGFSWTDIPGSGNEILTFAANPSKDGFLYRASAATPSVGRVYSQIAQLTVKTPAVGEIEWSLSFLQDPDYFPGNVLSVVDGNSAAPQFGRANGQLFLQHHRSTDGVNWDQSIGIQSGYVYWDVVHHFSGLYVAWLSTLSLATLPVQDLRWISSDGRNWEAVGPVWKTRGIGRDTGNGLEVIYSRGLDERPRLGLTVDGRDILEQGLLSDLASQGLYPFGSTVLYFAEELSGVAAQTYLDISGGTRQSRIGSSAWISDIFLCFARGMVNGQMCWVASTNEDFHYTADGATTTRLARPAGINFRYMAYGLGTWLAVHQADPTIYYTAPDLTGPWKTNSLSSFGAMAYWDRLGRPEFVDGRFVIPLSQGDARQVSGFLASN
jgi:hypothetical protein